MVTLTGFSRKQEKQKERRQSFRRQARDTEQSGIWEEIIAPDNYRIASEYPATMPTPDGSSCRVRQDWPDHTAFIFDHKNYLLNMKAKGSGEYRAFVYDHTLKKFTPVGLSADEERQ